MNLRERKKDKTRTQLLEAALDLIGRQGFADTTISQIAAAVDVSPRTLLRYFPTKEDVIVSWVEEGMSIFFDCLLERMTGEPVHVSLLAAAHALLESYEKRADFYLVIERTIASSSAISARKLEMSSALSEKVTEFLKRRSGESPQAALASELYPGLVFSMMRVAIRIWVAGGGSRPLMDIFNETKALVRFESTA